MRKTKPKGKGKGSYLGLLGLIVMALVMALAVIVPQRATAGTPFLITLQVDAASSVSAPVQVPITAESGEYIDVLSAEANSLGDATSATLYLGPQPVDANKANLDADWTWKHTTNGVVQSATTAVVSTVANKVPISIQRANPSYVWVTTNASVGATTGTVTLRGIISRRE